MNRKLTINEILEYYDGIQLFIGQDVLGVFYVCLLVEQAETDLFLCCPVTDTRLRSFMAGEIDLLEIYKSPEVEDLALLRINDYTTSEHLLEPLAVSDLPPKWLPSQGYHITPHESLEALVEESRRKHRAVFHLSLRVPESQTETQIGTTRLAEALQIFQNLVTNAWKRVSNVYDKASQVFLERDILSDFNVYGFSSGSFTVLLQSEAHAELFGDMGIAEALERIDQLTASLQDDATALEIIRQNKGHLADSYIRFLEYLSREKTAVSYSWTVPSFQAPRSQAISTSTAEKYYSLFISVEDLSVESKTLVGRFTKVNTASKLWTIRSESDDKHYSGSTSGNILSGVVIETQPYRLYCEEHLQVELGTGKEHIDLVLLRLEESA